MRTDRTGMDQEAQAEIEKFEKLAKKGQTAKEKLKTPLYKAHIYKRVVVVQQQI